PVFLDVLAVIAFRVGEPEQPLLEDRIVLVPQGDREAEVLPPVADAAETVFSPPVRPRTRVIVREVVPRGSAGAVVLAHRAPLACRQIRTPPPPPLEAGAVGVEPVLFRVASHGATA